MDFWKFSVQKKTEQKQNVNTTSRYTTSNDLKQIRQYPLSRPKLLTPSEEESLAPDSPPVPGVQILPLREESLELVLKEAAAKVTHEHPRQERVERSLKRDLLAEAGIEKNLRAGPSWLKR